MARLDGALALARGGGDRFVAWAIALKAFFAALALAGLLACGHAAAMWRAAPYAVATAVLPADSAPETRAAALEAVRRAPGVARAALLPAGEVAALLARWIGGADAARDLPLPALIDIEVEPGGVFDRAAAEAALRRAAPGAALDAGPPWIEKLAAAAAAAQLAMAAVLAFVALVAALAVAFATRAAVTAHRETIELLHWLGADDREVAGAFQRRALTLGLRGGLSGTLAALAALVPAARAAARLDAPLLADFAAPAAAWGVFGAVPLAAAAVAVLAARRTALGALARMY